jgi:hypothetical protein
LIRPKKRKGGKMDKKEKPNNESVFQEGDFSSPLRKFKEMAEMMRNCCPGKGEMADCCSIMKKMMQCYEGKEETEKKKETRKTG